MAEESWASLVAQEVASSKTLATELWPVLCQSFRSKKVASDVLGFLVSPYAQRFLCKPDDGSEVVNVFEEFSVIVNVRRVNPWFVEWRLNWPAAAEPPPNEDIFRSCPALKQSMRDCTELGAVVCDRGDFVPQLLNLLRASCEDDGALSKEGLEEARETQTNFRSHPTYLYKHVVRLLFTISEPLQHHPDPRFSPYLGSPSGALDRRSISEELTEERLKELAHPWLKEEAVVVQPTPLADLSEDVECLRLIDGELKSQPVAVRFVAWDYVKSESSKLCYLFVCPEEPALKKVGWQKPALVEAEGWVTHPLKQCQWSWPEEMEGIGPVDVRSMCCGNVPIYRRMIKEFAKPVKQLRDELGAMNTTDYRSFVLKALDYFAD